jgi:hypothetical protein
LGNFRKMNLIFLSAITLELPFIKLFIAELTLTVGVNFAKIYLTSLNNLERWEKRHELRWEIYLYTKKLLIASRFLHFFVCFLYPFMSCMWSFCFN